MVTWNTFLEVKVAALEFIGWECSKDTVDGSGVGVSEKGGWGRLVSAVFGSDCIPESFSLECEGDGACADIFIGIHHDHNLFAVGLPRLDGRQEVLSEGLVGLAIWVRWRALSAEVELVLVIDFKETAGCRLAGIVGHCHPEFVVLPAFDYHGCPAPEASGVAGDGGNSVGRLKGGGHSHSSRDAIFFKGTGPVLGKVALGATESGAVGAVVPLVSVIQVSPVQANLRHRNDVQL